MFKHDLQYQSEVAHTEEPETVMDRLARFDRETRTDLSKCALLLFDEITPEHMALVVAGDLTEFAMQCKALLENAIKAEVRCLEGRYQNPQRGTV